MRHIQALAELTDAYDVLLCDVWGVLHNGITPYPGSVRALQAAREAGKRVILVTNSPRPGDDVAVQLDMIGVSRDAWDAIVSSGDVTRTLIADGPRRVFHLGPERDLPLFDGTGVELVEDFEASAVVCTGLFDDESETPETYADMLARFRARNLPFICANPDIVVERGDRLVWCAGALARDYGLLGGRTLIAGKPHHPIYDAAMATAEQLLGAAPARSRVLAIGDGILTDVKGADAAGFDVLYVSGGIHAREYMGPSGLDRSALDAFLQKHGMAPVATLVHLA